MTAWQPGSPPVADDGSVVLVRLDMSADAIKCYCDTYYGGPVAVYRWSTKLKTTYGGVRIEYEDCVAWCEVPE